MDFFSLHIKYLTIGQLCKYDSTVKELHFIIISILPSYSINYEIYTFYSCLRFFNVLSKSTHDEFSFSGLL